jgi:hypothetical protein
MVLVASPTCVWSTAPELPPLIETAKLLMRAEAERRGLGFAAIGVSRSGSANAGIKDLQRFGTFDEVAAGRTWYNTLLLRYVYRDFVGAPATPQVIVLERTVAAEERPGISEERVLLRTVGFGAIRRWVEMGVPIPLTSADSTDGSGM